MDYLAENWADFDAQHLHRWRGDRGLQRWPWAYDPGEKWRAHAQTPGSRGHYSQLMNDGELIHLPPAVTDIDALRQ